MPGFSVENKNMQEYCLIANILVPDTEEKKLPVLVIVHGGAFQVGWGNMLTAKNLTRAKNTVVVTFNYRLGAHGFLCLGTEDVPGNAGMKDQVALLRWVKQNIAYFGGDPDDVTISGYSAGSSSVDLLLLSKMSRGLFKKVIAESGSHLAAFSVQRDPLENAKKFAKELDSTINVDDVYALEKFYKSISYEQLTVDSFMDRTDSTFFFSPCVERKTNEEIFLEEDPIKIIKTDNYPKIPLLYGFSNMEGLLRIGFFEFWKTKMNDNFTEFLPADLQFKNNNEKDKVVQAIKEFYFGDKPVTGDNILSYVNYFTDVIFAYPTLRSIKMQVEGGHDKIYLYEYSFVDDSNILVPYTDIRGANHCAQTMAVLDGINLPNAREENASEEFKKMRTVIRELWSNFITIG